MSIAKLQASRLLILNHRVDPLNVILQTSLWYIRVRMTNNSKSTQSYTCHLGKGSFYFGILPTIGHHKLGFSSYGKAYFIIACLVGILGSNPLQENSD